MTMSDKPKPGPEKPEPTLPDMGLPWRVAVLYPSGCINVADSSEKCVATDIEEAHALFIVEAVNGKAVMEDIIIENLRDAEKEATQLRAENTQLREALEKIAGSNGDDYLACRDVIEAIELTEKIAKAALAYKEGKQ